MRFIGDERVEGWPMPGRWPMWTASSVRTLRRVGRGVADLFGDEDLGELPYKVAHALG